MRFPYLETYGTGRRGGRRCPVGTAAAIDILRRKRTWALASARCLFVPNSPVSGDYRSQGPSPPHQVFIIPALPTALNGFSQRLHDDVEPEL